MTKHLCQLENSLVCLQEVLPGCRLQPNASEQIQALLEDRASVVARLVNKQVVLQHFVTQRVWNEALVRLRFDLDKASCLAGDLLELGDDARWDVIVSRGKDLLPQDRVSVADSSNYVFSCSQIRLAVVPMHIVKISYRCQIVCR